MMRKYREWLQKRRKSLFRIQPILWIMSSLMYTFIALNVVYMIIGFSQETERFSLVVVSFTVFFIVILFGYYGIKYRNLFFSKKNDPLGFDDTCFLEIKPFSKSDFLFLPDLLLKVLFRMRTVKYYRVLYRTKVDGVMKQCSTVLTMDQLDFLGKLDHPDTFYPGISYWHKSLLFDKVPIKIFYGKNSRMLSKIAPVEEYGYTLAQMDLFEQFNSAITKNTVSFILFPFIISAYALVLSLFCASFLLIVESLSFSLGEVELVCLAMLFLTFLRCAMFSDGYISKWFAEKNDFLCSQNVILKESCPLRLENGSRRYLKCIFPEEEPIFQYVAFHPNKNTKKNLKPQPQNGFYWVLTKEKIDALNVLYGCKLSYVCSYERNGGHSLIRTEFSFDGDLLLNVAYSSKGKELKSIAPVEGYEYTEEQLAAIEKFNTLYP